MPPPISIDPEGELFRYPPLYAANTGPGLAGPHEEGDGEHGDEPQQVVTRHRLLVRIVYKGGQTCTDREGTPYG